LHNLLAKLTNENRIFCLANTYIGPLFPTSEGLPVYPQAQDAPCLEDRAPLDTNSLNHSYQTIKHKKFEVSLLRNLEKQNVGMPVSVF